MRRNTHPERLLSTWCAPFVRRLFSPARVATLDWKTPPRDLQTTNISGDNVMKIKIIIITIIIIILLCAGWRGVLLVVVGYGGCLSAASADDFIRRTIAIISGLRQIARPSEFVYGERTNKKGFKAPYYVMSIQNQHKGTSRVNGSFVRLSGEKARSRGKKKRKIMSRLNNNIFVLMCMRLSCSLSVFFHCAYCLLHQQHSLEALLEHFQS